ncbi:MAG: putative spermidine/putrescine transport system permease protein [Chloroflexota bacterium]|jgi:ABC-type spermidine/putrescine transport system permease subunit II|nr:putative spermidine/putrescine transport system permease protein [Chloroflexota bacterium]
MTDTGQATAMAARRRPAGRTGARRWLSAWGPALPLIGLVAFCLVGPQIVLVLKTFATPDGLGLGSWTRVLGQAVNQRAIVTSLAVGFVCAFISTAVGTPVAWLITRMLPGRRGLWLGLFNVAAHFGGIGLAFGYVATLGTLGMLTLFVQGLGIPFVPPARESVAALVLVYEYTNVPLFVLLIIPALGILREDWQEAAQASSATRLQFWRRVGIPVLLPFISAGFVLAFTWAIGIYSIAYGLVGQSAVTPVALITLQIGSAMEDVVNGPTRAGVLSVVLLVVAFASLVAYRALMRRGMRWFAHGRVAGTDAGLSLNAATSRSAFASGSARDGRARVGRGVLFGLILAYLCIPILAVVLYSFATRWSAHVLPDGYTLDWWTTAFADERIGSAFVTSLVLGALTAAIDIVVVVPAVYWARVRNPRIRPVLDLSAAIPFALPFLVIAFALLQFTGIVAPGLQGTFPLLVLGSAAVCFPFVYWAVDGAMAAVSIERIAEAAETCGASPLQIMRRVVLPNIRPGLATGGLLCFATALGEFAIVQILASSVRTVPIWSAEAIRDTTRRAGGLNELAVATTVMFALLLGVSALVVRGRGGTGTTAPVLAGVPSVDGQAGA